MFLFQILNSNQGYIDTFFFVINIILLADLYLARKLTLFLKLKVGMNLFSAGVKVLRDCGVQTIEVDTFSDPQGKE